MFGLPTATLLIIVGIPLGWIAYTLIFFFSSSHWGAEDAEESALGTPEEGGAL